MRKPFKKSWQYSAPELLFEGRAVRRICITEQDPQSKNLKVLNHGVLKPGLRLPWFHHEDLDEVIIPLVGSSIVHFKEADSIAIEIGSVLCIPAGIHHSVENNSDCDFEAIFFKVHI